jgi:hypothetical protein
MFIYFLVIFFLPKFSKFTCNISLSLIYILKEQSSEETFSLFFSLQTWFSFALTHNLDQVCVLSNIFARSPIHPPLGALTTRVKEDVDQFKLASSS